MNIQLPNGERLAIPDYDDIEQRKNKVVELLEEFDAYIIQSWDSPKVIYFLNGLSNYLVWFKEEELVNKLDKDVLSKTKTKNLNKYDKHNIPFSSLSLEESIKYGLSETEVKE